VAGVERHGDLLEGVSVIEATPLLRPPSEAQDIVADYRHLGLTLGRHPMALLRDRFARHGFLRAEALADCADGEPVQVAGIVVTRQRPGSANGVNFVTLEDETGYINLVIWKDLADSERRVLVGARLMAASGKVQKQGDVIHVVVRELGDYNNLLGELTTVSRDFH
jgi:error-prone DNA polymerase